MCSASSQDVVITVQAATEIKRRATEVYATQELSLDEAIELFLRVSIEARGLSLALPVETPSYGALRRLAHKAQINEEGVAVLPQSWGDGAR